MRPLACKVVTHVINLLYPFSYQREHLNSGQSLDRLSKRWQHIWHGLSRSELVEKLDDTYFFLPYVREVLFAESRLFFSDAPEKSTSSAQRLSRSELTNLASMLGPDAVLRLKAAPEFRAQFGQFNLQPYQMTGNPGDPALMALVITNIELALFPGGVGLLRIRVQAADNEPTVASLRELINHAREVQPKRLEWGTPRWVTHASGKKLSVDARTIVDYLLMGVTAPDSDTDLGISLVEFAARTESNDHRYTSTAPGQVYGQNFQVFTYALLDDSVIEELPAETGLSGDQWDRALFELVTCSDLSQENQQPAVRFWDRVQSSNKLVLWRNWKAMCLRDNVAFVARGDSIFTRQYLPQNIEKDYLEIYQLVIYQLIRLNLLQGRLLRHNRDLSSNLRSARTLWNDHVHFTNRFWYSHLCVRPQGNEIFQCFRAGVQVDALHDEVGSEVRELKAFYEERRQRFSNAILFFISVVGFPVGIVVGLFGNALLEPELEYKWPLFLISAVVAIGVAWGIKSMWERIDSKVS